METLEINFNDNLTIKDDFILFQKITLDRGSPYVVLMGKVEKREDVKKFINKIRNYNKKF